jgi:hypothetical protein
MSVYPVDEPFKLKGELKENTIQGFIHSMTNLGENTTPRDIGERLALGVKDRGQSVLRKW